MLRRAFLAAAALAACLFSLTLAQTASTPASAASTKTYSIKGAGGTFPEVLYQDAMFSYKYVTTNVDVSYLPTGSGGGKCRIKTGSSSCDTMGEPYKVDFAGSDSLLVNKDNSSYPDLQMYPTVAGAVTAVYSHPAVKATGKPMVLKMSTIAYIFGGDIKTWDDSRILADQEHPEVTAALQSMPGKAIEVVVRGETSGTTQIWTTALTLGLEQSGLTSSNVVASDSPTGAWPNPSMTYTRQPGNEELAAYVATTDYTFGYIVLGYALDTGASVVWVRSVNGKNIIEPSIDAVQFAVAELGLSFGNTGDPADRLTAAVEGAQGTFAWPAAGYTYLVMRKDTDVFNDCARRQATVDFWHCFYTSDVAKSLAVLHGFSPLPESVSTKVVTRLLSDIKCADGSLAQPDAGLQIPIYYSGPSNLEKIMELYGNSYISMNPEMTLLYTAIDTGKTSADWRALWAPMVANQPLIAPQSSEGENWWIGQADTVAIPFVEITTALYINACNSATSCPTNPTIATLSLNTLAQIISGSISGTAVWTSLGLNNTVAPTILCPPSASAERVMMTTALTSAYSNFSWAACQDTTDTDIDYSFTTSSVISKAGTLGFLPLSSTMITHSNVYKVSIDGTSGVDGFNVAFNFILRQNQGSTCTTSTKTLAQFTGWTYGNPSDLKEGQSSIDFAKPLKDADMTPLGYTNNVGINGSNELTCDGESINNPPTSSTRASLTTYALIAAIGGFVLSVGIALFIAARRGKLDLDQIMSLLFSEPVCILVDVFFNFGDVLAFALATFYTIQGDVTFKNVYPIAVLFTAIAFVSTLTTAFVSIRLFMRIMAQKKDHAADFVAVHAKQIAKRASFRAMQQQTNVERRHIDEALSALHKENTQHMDEVEHLEREILRKQADIITIVCECIPVIAIQAKIESIASEWSVISTISVIIAAIILGNKVGGLTTYMECRHKLKEAQEKLRTMVKEEIKRIPGTEGTDDGYTDPRDVEANVTRKRGLFGL